MSRYLVHPTRERWFIVMCIAAACAVCVAALFIGAVSIPVASVLHAVLRPRATESLLVTQLRAPRVVLAFAVGGSLAVAGASLQATIRNPLAEPWILGMSGGAALGAVAAIMIGVPPGFSVAACATVGAIVAAITVYRVSVVAGRAMDPRILLLAGVIVGSFFAAISAAMLMLADPYRFQAASMWLFGGFAGATWRTVVLVIVTSALPLVVLWRHARALDLLALGDEPAAMLGLSVGTARRAVVGTTAVITAVSVAAAGVIGFVGLVVPHSVRWMIGPLHRRLLPLAFVVGGTFTVAADTIARSALPGREIPVGVVTALAGVPVFAMLLRKTLT